MTRLIAPLYQFAAIPAPRKPDFTRISYIVPASNVMMAHFVFLLGNPYYTINSYE
jgi:hypothetical protein